MNIFKQKLLLSALFIGALSTAQAAAKMTGFIPEKHGFNFDNTFNNNFISEVDLRTGGLCGGMVYSAYDYYNAKKTIPTQDYRPADHMPLHRYIYDRQVTSLLPNLDKWAEIGTNPGGVRNNEFFEWGLQGVNGGRLQELREFIDKGKPVPLGLESADSSTGRHQILAIGYDMGRYKGDLKSFPEDLKIFVYDPNYHDRIMTLIPDMRNKYYTYAEKPDKHWRTYFVDKKYTAKMPPTIVTQSYPDDKKIHELVIELGTGNDDLRGGNDNLNIIVESTNGKRQEFKNVNGGRRWISNYSQYVSLPLSQPVTRSEIRNIRLNTTFGGGTGGDNWDMSYIRVRGLGHKIDEKFLFSKDGTPVFRFTGNAKEYNARIINDVAGKASELKLVIGTGNDDLRGGNDNLDVTIQLRGGHRQVARNINNGMRWADRTSHTVTIPLDSPVDPSQIQSIIISASVAGGAGGDNWNMDSLKIDALGGGITKHMYNKSGSPLVRITGQNKSFTANTQ